MKKEKIKCFRITPAVCSRHDSTIYRNDGSWFQATSGLEESLERQFLEGIPWNEISVKVECIEMTEEELSELDE